MKILMLQRDCGLMAASPETERWSVLKAFQTLERWNEAGTSEQIMD
jgi:hypothetical protein